MGGEVDALLWRGCNSGCHVLSRNAPLACTIPNSDTYFEGASTSNFVHRCSFGRFGSTAYRSCIYHMVLIT